MNIKVDDKQAVQQHANPEISAFLLSKPLLALLVRPWRLGACCRMLYNGLFVFRSHRHEQRDRRGSALAQMMEAVCQLACGCVEHQ